MNFKVGGIRALVAITSMSLVACGGGGGGSSLAALTPSHSAATAHGTLKLIFPKTKTAATNASRKPAFVSFATLCVYLAISDNTGPGSFADPFSCTTTPGPCNLQWTSTTGDHTFYVEATDSKSTPNILLEGSTAATLTPGNNVGITVTLNGVAALIYTSIRFRQLQPNRTDPRIASRASTKPKSLAALA